MYQATVKLIKIGNEARKDVHTNDTTRRCVVSSYTIWACSFMDLEILDCDPAELYGEGGCILTEIAREFDYELMHTPLHYTGNDLVMCFPGWAIGPLVHW